MGRATALLKANILLCVATLPETTGAALDHALHNAIEETAPPVDEMGSYWLNELKVAVQKEQWQCDLVKVMLGAIQAVKAGNRAYSERVEIIEGGYMVELFNWYGLMERIEAETTPDLILLKTSHLVQLTLIGGRLASEITEHCSSPIDPALVADAGRIVDACDHLRLMCDHCLAARALIKLSMVMKNIAPMKGLFIQRGQGQVVGGAQPLVKGDCVTGLQEALGLLAQDVILRDGSSIAGAAAGSAAAVAASEADGELPAAMRLKLNIKINPSKQRGYSFKLLNNEWSCCL